MVASVYDYEAIRAGIERLNGQTPTGRAFDADGQEKSGEAFPDHYASVDHFRYAPTSCTRGLRELLEERAREMAEWIANGRLAR